MVSGLGPELCFANTIVATGDELFWDAGVEVEGLEEGEGEDVDVDVDDMELDVVEWG